MSKIVLGCPKPLELYACFLLGNADIIYSAEFIRSKLSLQNPNALSEEEQVLIALCFSASCTFNPVVGNNIWLEWTHCNCEWWCDTVAVSIALARLVIQFIFDWPKPTWGSCSILLWLSTTVTQLKGKALHQHPTWGWHWPHHYKLHDVLAWVFSCCSSEGEYSNTESSCTTNQAE